MHAHHEWRFYVTERWAPLANVVVSAAQRRCGQRANVTVVADCEHTCRQIAAAATCTVLPLLQSATRWGTDVYFQSMYARLLHITGNTNAKTLLVTDVDIVPLACLPLRVAADAAPAHVAFQRDTLSGGRPNGGFVWARLGTTCASSVFAAARHALVHRGAYDQLAWQLAAADAPHCVALLPAERYPDGLWLRRHRFVPHRQARALHVNYAPPPADAYVKTRRVAYFGVPGARALLWPNDTAEIA